MKIWFFIIFTLIIAFENIFIENILSKIIFLWDTKSVYITSYYSLVTLLGFMSVTLLFFIKEKIYFFLVSFLLLFTYSIELVYKDINSIGFGLNELSLVLNEGDAFALDALITYGISIKKALFILLIFVFIFFVIRKIIVKKKIFMKTKYIMVFLLFAFILAYSITFKTTSATQTRPNIIKFLNTTLYYASNRLYYGEREILHEKATLTEKYQNIILIVDESIGGEYLSINGYGTETTPYLKSIKNYFINLGLASSGANCSAKSNLILMSGIQLAELPDMNNRALKKATIFQYAKNAGYKTHYISGQGLGLKLQNHITQYDLKYIDNFSQLEESYQHKNMPEEDVIVKTVKALNNREKNFIFIVKHGSHFPWEESYPKNERHFLPTLEVSNSLSLDYKLEAVNSYLNSIRYNVDLFFKYFLQEIDFFSKDDTLIIYTSDHGQSILEEGRTSTHCDSTNPPLSQGIVPLILFTNPKDSFLRNIDFKLNSYNHYQLFPTLQTLMGYENISSETIFDEVNIRPQQVFVSGDIFGRVSLQENDISTR
ncbi:MAG: Unknown protein [uncultured Sulfurovum sp.]|uniref:Sulfatase N-terminal domain-containing protein n=1 Tax=uncultured Sulfurovum sp. TaxID=269237 RepID=A0A6S6TGV6_9BACT|nr:MAG: Unknown protein [uncultured Sulfurovum sp.]